MEATLLYLDHNASTPLLPEVIEAMEPYLKLHYGNPSSTHSYGLQGREALETARGQLAELLHCQNEELIFTSGGSESNNMAIKGVAELHPGGHIITSAIEHPAVLEVCRYLETRGYRVDYLPVDSRGLINPQVIAEAIRPDTFLITIMLANNEVGTIQPVREIARIAHEHNITMHTDAAQAMGKIPVDVNNLEVDLLSIAGHKMNAPKGIGALYIRTGIEIVPLIHGAGHEQGLRPGTENVLEIVGLGAAAHSFHEKENEIGNQLKELRELFWEKLQSSLPFIELNGHPEKRLPNTINVHFPGIDANTLLAETPQVAASAGAACHADSPEPSHVLKAMGFSEERILGSVRFSVGRTTTKSEVEAAIDKLAAVVERLSAKKSYPEVQPEPGDIRLTRYTHGLGCACKLRPQNLEKILKRLILPQNQSTQVGFETADDAAVYRLNEELSIVATVDFFTPIVDSPYDFGRIAAANALSDIYAMGAKPLFALNIVAFPEKRLPLQVLEEILNGAQAIAQEAQIPILGGHTIEDNEPKFGLAVTGAVHPDKIWRNTGIEAADALILTKPLGTGILSTALKRGLLDEKTTAKIVAIMTRLNAAAASIAGQYTVHACTDITGFGLLGHLLEMTRSSAVDATLFTSKIPVIPGTTDLVRRDIIPGGTKENRNHTEPEIIWDPQISSTMKTILNDAQTSGGLLLAVPRREAEALIADLYGNEIRPVAVIGYCKAQHNGKISVVP